MAAALAGALPVERPIFDGDRSKAASTTAPGRVSRAIISVIGADPPPGAVADFYRAREGRPVWISNNQVRPAAAAVVGLIERAAEEGLNPLDYDPSGLRNALRAAATGRASDLAMADLALSTRYGAYVADLHRPPPSAELAFRDPALPPPVDATSALKAIAAAPDPASGIIAARRMHPYYEALRAELNTRPPGDPLRPLILANMARARALPADPGPRYVLVNVAAQRLTLVEGGETVDEMRVIVGTRNAQTPALGGLIRYAKFQPYWNVPPDIVRDEIAPEVLRQGFFYLERQQMEILSGWSAGARVVAPSEVNWADVASGATTLRVRRLPGATNILGRVKLMLPNPLGIYLHDTPNKAAFRSATRTLSHGCIRLEDALRLTRRLFGSAADHPPSGVDARVDLERPVPVYVVYLTLEPSGEGIQRWADIYGRDPSLLSELGAATAPT